MPEPSRLFFFADEAGCFNFSRAPGASKYFVVCTIATADCSQLGTALLDLRRTLIWEGAPVAEFFHATTDKQAIRDRVFDVLQKQDFTAQATIMEKSKAMPKVRPTRHRFYHVGWYHHFKFAGPKTIGAANEIQITTASVGTKKGQAVFSNAVNDVAQQVIRGGRTYRTTFCPSMADPCLQAADYCTWAIQRKWEHGDDRSWKLIADRITHEVDMWSHGKIHYY
jgi:hypothetical protein